MSLPIIGRSEVLGLIAMALVLGVLGGACSRRAPAVAGPAPARAQEPAASPPIHGSLEEVHLIDQDGHPFALEQLHGRVWITAFMFTSCPMECPLLAQRMAYIQKLLVSRRPAVQLLSISVNPQQDTPAVLRDYGARFHRDPARWTFLTGKTDPVLKSVSAGYDRAAVAAQRPQKPGGFAALHGDNLVLIDGDGQIRGYYGKDDAQVTRLLADADRLAGAAPR